MNMEKEKRKGRPCRRWLIISILTVVVILIGGGYWAWSWVATPRSASDLSQFETEEEVLAFLHQNLEIHVTTKDEVLNFVSAYPIDYGECKERLLTPESRESNNEPDEAETLIYCGVPTWGTIAGVMGYTLIFYFDADEVLVDMDANYYCHCL